jgi:hypothetical protein
MEWNLTLNEIEDDDGDGDDDGHDDDNNDDFLRPWRYI